MYTWFTKIWQILGKDNIFFYEGLLLKRAFTVLSIQFAGVILAFGSNLLLARLYGEQVYGIYSLVSSWSVLLSVVALFGMDDSHLVKVPVLKLKGEKRKLKEQLKWSLIINIISTSIVAILFYLIINFVAISRLSENAYYFNYSLAMICFLTLLNNLICFLRGLDKVVLGELVDKISRPVFFILFLLIFFYLGKTNLTVNAIIANSMGLLSASLLLGFAIIKNLKRIESGHSFEKGNFSLAPNTRYVLLNLLYILSTRVDILLLGLFSETTAVGHYNIAVRIADIISSPIAIINLSLPTLISKERIQKGEQSAPLLMYRISKNSFFQCMLIGLFFMATGHWILGWYGTGFTNVFPVLVIFFLSSLISACTGSIDMFFILSGHERKIIYIRILSLVLTLSLSIFLIPRWNTIGAAIAMLIGNLIYCILLQYSFFKKYGIFIHPFAKKNKLHVSNTESEENKIT